MQGRGFSVALSNVFVYTRLQVGALQKVIEGRSFSAESHFFFSTWKSVSLFLHFDKTATKMLKMYK